MTLHEGSAVEGPPEGSAEAQAAAAAVAAAAATTSSDAQAATSKHHNDEQNKTTPNTTNLDTSTTKTASNNQDEQTTAQQPNNSSDAAQEGKTIKQFSDKSLEELAQYYLNLEPANIPDTGYVVSGIAGRFPSADNLNELWENLLNGRDMVLGPDDKRWPLGEFLLHLHFSFKADPFSARQPV